MVAQTQASAKAAPLRYRAAEGMVLITGLNVFSRIALFGSQIALGYLLTPEDFGVAGLATIFTTVAWQLMGFGVDSILQHRNRTLHFWERPAFFVTLGQGFVCLVLLALAAPLSARLMNAPHITGPIIVTALSMPIVALSIVPMAKISAALDFKWIFVINLVELIGTQCLTLLFAYAGLGAYAFFLPVPIMFGVRAAIAFWRAPLRLRHRTRTRQWLMILASGMPIFAASLVLTLITQGDYFVLGLFASSQIVGYYFFAFRLAAMPARVIAGSLQGILFSTLARFGSDARRKSSAALRAAEALSYVVTPFCFLQAAVAGPILSLFFADKWEASIPLVQLLSLGFPAEALNAVTRAHLAATGQFKRSLHFTLVSAVFFFTFVTLGAYFGQAIGVAIGATAYYLFVQPPIFFRTFPPEGDLLRQVVRIYIRPIAISFGSAALGYASARAFVPPGMEWLEVLIILCLSGAAYVVLLRTTCARVFRELWDLAKHLFGRIGLVARPS